MSPGGEQDALPTVSVILPVFNGGDLLREVIDAVLAQDPHEFIVTDSGSSDGSLELARERGLTVIEIPPAEFKHGPTRNLAASHATGEVLAFLTQDATPVPGWLRAIQEAMAQAPELGALFGPHLARPDTSPMVARELAEFFATFAAPDGGVRSFGPGDPTFLSNVNAAYRRACWEEIRFDDIAYSEDQAFGRALATHPRWRKAYSPDAAVLHAHDYSPTGFFQRYFDEYRGLKETVGYAEPVRPLAWLRGSARNTLRDARWVREQRAAGWGQVAATVPRAAGHHLGRHVAAALGTRAAGLPDALEVRLSLEGRASRAQDASAAGSIALTPQPPLPNPYAGVAQAWSSEPEPLTGDGPARADRDCLHVAFVIPWFRIGSGGHMTIFRLVEQLEAAGHSCTLWLDDPLGYSPEPAAVLRQTIVEHFRPIKAPLFRGFSQWYGADVVVATGWQTAYTVLRLPATAARAYLVQDAEPEFFATSAERAFAERTYGLGLHGIAASPWLAEMVRGHGSPCGSFFLAADHAVYRPLERTRRRDTVAFYARHETARRGVPLGALALEEVVRRRPDTRIVTFGSRTTISMDVPTLSAGVLGSEELAQLYAESTVGLCLSLTNYSLIPGEMTACGLPCVDVDHPSAVGVFGTDGPVSFARPDVMSLADAVERLLADREEWGRRSAAGLEFARAHTWEGAGAQVESELREALRLAPKA